MQTIRFYMAGALSLLIIAGSFSVAYYQGAFGALTSQAASLSARSVASTQATPVEQPVAGPNAVAPPSNSDNNTHATTPQTGAPAIKPHTKNAGPDTPAFTEDDVRQFASTLSKGLGRIDVVGAMPNIDKIQFLTTAALQAQSAEAVSLQTASDTLLCYVVYSGDFAVHSPMGLSPISYKHAMQVFDAHSGNLLMQSAYDRK
ncbi:MAG: hypothetical protein IVW55_10285 [Chloroflexi bacterium]|nr:hypothetical protein [Chloroflexota bacterium]